MDKQQARDIVKENLGNSFEKNNFTNFIRNLLNKIDESKAFHARGYVPESYKKYVKTYERIATYTDPEGLKIDVLIVYLQGEKTLERARTGQRNFIAHYLKDRDQKDAGLIAFVSPDPSDWRFSLVKMDYLFEEGENGKVKAKQEFTPARRWSFLVGQNENSHTAQTRLLPIMADDGHPPTLAELEEAFNIETVTKEFFLEYRNLFILVKESLDAIVAKDATIKNNFAQNDVNTVDFAKKLLGQIVFLYFLQKKGWFGVAKKADWGTGSKNFLRELFEKKYGSYDNFFNDILEPLFYEALRLDRSHEDHYYSRFNCKIPFLNGGLFDPIKGYDWVNTDIILPNDLFSNKQKTKVGDIGNGILDVFDRYNFTVKEDEPLEKEVAIDPELLGKAYEKFNAIRPDNFEEYKKALKSGNKGEESKFNKQFGVYYTPREIVHYMCQQSLINYLAEQFNGGAVIYEKTGDEQTDLLGNTGKKGQLDLTIEHTEKIRIPKEDVETLIYLGERLNENEEMALIKQQKINEGHQKTSDYKLKLPEIIRKNAEEIDKKLASIKVCDPAIGSGAFPVGMMNEIVRTRNVLGNFINDKDRSMYNFKRQCIENSLYGVDIDPGAVEIAKLRLWLSLVVEEDDIKNIKPLPNLDYKIVCGDSLIGFPDNWDSTVTKEIESLKHDYFSETNPTKKIELREQIDGKLRDRYDKSLKTFGYEVKFDFHTIFSEVFHEKNGFDIVIANPPYVRADNPNFKDQRKAILQCNYYKTLYEKWDLFVPFIERGLNITNTKGDLIYIVSNSICTSKYAIKLLDLVQNEYFLRSINYFEDMTVFEAGVIPILLQIGKINTDNKLIKIIHQGNFKNIVSETCIPMAECKLLGRDAFRKEYNPLVLKKKTVDLGDICYLSVGMVLNADEKLAKGEFKVDDLISNTKTKVNSRKYIEAKDIENWVIKRVRYLEWNTDRCPAKIRRKTFPELYNRPKLMVGSLTGGIYDDDYLLTHHGIVIFVRFCDLKGVNNKSIQMSVKKFNKDPRNSLEKVSECFDLRYLLAIINSSFANNYLNNIRRHRLENYFYPDDFRKLPIIHISVTEQRPFIELVNKIFLITKNDDYLQKTIKQAKVKEYERQIDQMVYKLYDLTPEEIKIVEKT